MKDNITKPSGRNRWIKAAILFVAILWTPRELPARGSKLAADEWHIQYTLTVKGKGTTKPVAGKEYMTLYWSINRTYTGYATLRFKRKAKPNTTYESIENDRIQVMVDDRIRIFSKGDYQHDSWEDVTVLSNRKADATVPTRGTVSVRINLTEKKFLLDIGIKPKGTDKNGTYVTRTTIDRSGWGFGGRLTHEVGPVKTEEFSVANLWFPREEIGNTYGIFMFSDLPTDYQSEWKFDSGPVGIAEPLITSIPETKTDVKMHLTGRLSRRPLY